MSTPLYEGEIDCLAKRAFEPTTTRWVGVFARDELPNLNSLQRPFALIVNTQPRGQSGEHWLAIYGPWTGRLQFFDSFGRDPKFYNLKYDLVNHHQSFQSYSSANCGHYCIWFLYARALGSVFPEIIDDLANHKSDRDSFVRASRSSKKSLSSSGPMSPYWSMLYT